MSAEIITHKEKEQLASFAHSAIPERNKRLPIVYCLQRSNAACVRNMNRFNGGKLPGNSKHFFKTSKDKAVPGKRSFKRRVSEEEFLFVYL